MEKVSGTRTECNEHREKAGLGSHGAAVYQKASGTVKNLEFALYLTRDCQGIVDPFLYFRGVTMQFQGVES
jgi:hypothetical protein